MFPSLPQETRNELTQLSQRYGQPLVRTVTLEISQRFDPLNKTDRFGEVCMVIRRPSGHLLTMTKTYYPTNAFRLLTGGINHGEKIYDALLRETQEETGLEVHITRFLAATAYQIPQQEEPAFYTFAFLLDEIGGTLGVIDESEQVEEFREVTPSGLLQVATELEQTTARYSEEIGGSWGDWGHFRAAIHHLVYEALQS
jgi:ADP-ribose pyrophosphatase YjhB (NUDIX family)